VPLLLVFALINRPEIFDLRPGSSLIEFLLDEGFDVSLVDWGVPRRRGCRHGARLLHLR
jgi:polyhydroxyalkanoate synthase